MIVSSVKPLVIALSLLFLVLLAPSFAFSHSLDPAQPSPSRGGWINALNVIRYDPVEHWYGVSGIITLWSAETLYTNVSGYTTNFSTTGLNFHVICPGRNSADGYIMASNVSQLPNVDTLSPLPPESINHITGYAEDSGNNTFIETANFTVRYVNLTFRTIEDVPSAFLHRNSTRWAPVYDPFGLMRDSYVEGIMTDTSSNETPLIFITPFEIEQTGYNSSVQDFQLILPAPTNQSAIYFLYYTYVCKNLTILPLVTNGTLFNQSDVVDASVYLQGGDPPIQFVRANLTYPNKTVQEMNLTKVIETFWAKTINDTIQFEDYVLNYAAKDVKNVTAHTTIWFDVVNFSLPLVPFYGHFYDVDGSPINGVNVSLHRPNDTTAIIFSNASDSGGFYNMTVRQRHYDLWVSRFNATFILRNIMVNDNRSWVNTSEIKNISLGRPYPVWDYPALQSAYFSTNIPFSETATVIFNYSDSYYLDAYHVPWDPTKPNETHIGLYVCSAFNFSDYNCTLNWTRVTDSLTLIDEQNNVASFTVSNLSAFVLSAYLCGDGSCDSNYTESVSNCPRDCSFSNQTLPPNPPPTPVGAPAGAAGPGGPSTAPNVPAPEVSQQGKYTEIVPITLSTNRIEVVLEPGDFQLHNLGITNNIDKEVVAYVSTSGSIWEYTSIRQPEVRLDPLSTKFTELKFFTDPTTPPGRYVGEILVEAENIIKVVYVTILVRVPEEPLLDIKVTPLTPQVRPDQDATFRLSAFNLGQTRNITFETTYTIRSAETDEVVMKQTENIFIEATLSFARTFRIPKDVKPGKYIIEVSARYGGNVASSFNTFEIIQPLWIMDFFWAMFTSWVTYLFLLIVLPGAYIGSRMYNMYLAERRAHERYVSPVNYRLLPKAGPSAIRVGKIAETDIAAYIDMDKLTTHMIAAGGTGSGKSVSIMVVAEELLKRNVPVVVFDPTAQWTGFIRPQRDQRMLSIFPNFGLKPEDARAFKGTILEIIDPNTDIDIRKYMAKGEITIFSVSKMTPVALDQFVRRTIDHIFSIPWDESPTLKLFIVYDEVHRLLPKFGGKGGYIALERGCREFRKWGIGLAMISQVLMDFRGAIRTNIGTEIQLRTKYDGDIKRVQAKYGANYAETLPKLSIGTGLTQNPEYNEGRPWFISFRPLLHNTFRLTDAELKQYSDFTKLVTTIADEIASMKKAGRETYDLELELNLARDKIKQGQLRMAETYLESVKGRLNALRKV